MAHEPEDRRTPSGGEATAEMGRMDYRRVSRDPGVRGPKGYRRSDARIREDLCEALLHDERLDASDTSVDVLNGRVTLMGTVPERWMKHAMEDLAADCPGVIDVDNQLRVPRP